MKQSDKITVINGIGEKKAKLLEKLNVKTVRDLLYFLPRGYKDLSHVMDIADVPPGENAFMRIVIDTPVKTARIRQGLEITSFFASDTSGRIKVNIFNQVYVKQYLFQGKEIYIYGKPEYNNRALAVNSPEIYFKKPDSPYLPIYPLTAGLRQTDVRKAVGEAFSNSIVREIYGTGFLEKFGIMGLSDALYKVHFPDSMEEAKAARTRIVFDELLIFTRMLDMFNEEDGQKSHLKIKSSGDDFLKRLAFRPTNAQLKVMDEIKQDLSGGQYMNRLVQGDVGSGKTAVAFYAMDLLYKNGYSSIMMAPTEILAEQHAANARELFPQEDVILITGSMTKVKREKALKNAAEGVKIIVGTHALIYEEVAFENVGLIITDEQHRFGVKQRAKLAGGLQGVHTLIMSATPIPRSLSLVLYGKTKISIIDELPPGRTPVKTYLIHKNKYKDMISFIKKKIDGGRQGYIVCPVIEENPETELRSVKEVFAELENEFKSYNLGLLHGKLKSKEKQQMMDAFLNKEINLLVSTTVIEVGIDVPNATVMTVLNAERFGLAQLHQLRGRVGRGKHQSYCFLVSDSSNSYERLRVLVKTNDGFEIAEQDMKMRGAGDVFGTRQHGMSGLKIANLIEDSRQLEKAVQVLRILEKDRAYVREYGEITKNAARLMQDKMIEIAFN